MVTSSGEVGVCPLCDGEGAVGEPCSAKPCKRRGYRFVPREHLPTGGAVADPMVGRTVDDYLIVSVLGAGGFGKVYLALQLPIRLKAALKLLHRDARDPAVAQAMVQKFFGEAQALAALAHPNIVRLLKYGVHDEGPYLVMEYVAGARTLKDEVAERAGRGERLDAATARHILRQIVDGLDAAHGLHIIHRDIKPENVMLQAVAGNATFVRVVDFGLAKFVAERTETSMAMGTPVYMAPEQLLRRHIGPWTDLYAVGVIAYELMTGRRPFGGGTVEQIVAAKLDAGFDPLAAIQDIAVPEAAARFFARALARDTERRYQDAASFRVDLERAFDAAEAEHVAPMESVDLTGLFDTTERQRLEAQQRSLEAERRALDAERAALERERRVLDELRRATAPVPAPEAPPKTLGAPPRAPAATSGSPSGVPDVRTATSGSPREVPDVPTATSGSAREVPDVRTATLGSAREVPDVRTATLGSAREVPDVRTTTLGSAREVPDVRAATLGSAREVPDVRTTTLGSAREVPDVRTTTLGSARDVRDVPAERSGPVRTVREVRPETSGSPGTVPEVPPETLGPTRTSGVGPPRAMRALTPSPDPPAPEHDATEAVSEEVLAAAAIPERAKRARDAAEPFQASSDAVAPVSTARVPGESRAPAQRRRRRWPLLLVGLGVLGSAIGLVVATSGPGADPRDSPAGGSPTMAPIPVGTAAPHRDPVAEAEARRAAEAAEAEAACVAAAAATDRERWRRLVAEHPGAGCVPAAQTRLALWALEPRPRLDAILERLEATPPDPLDRPGLLAMATEALHELAPEVGWPVERLVALGPSGLDAAREDEIPIDFPERTVLLVEPGRYVLQKGLRLRRRRQLALVAGPGTEIFARSGQAVLSVHDAEEILLWGLYLNHHEVDTSGFRVDRNDCLYERYYPRIKDSDVVDVVDSRRVVVRASDLEGTGFIGLKLIRSREIHLVDTVVHDCISAGIHLEDSALVARNVLVYRVGARAYKTKFKCIPGNDSLCRDAPPEKYGFSLYAATFKTAVFVDPASELTMTRATVVVPEPLGRSQAFEIAGRLTLEDAVVAQRVGLFVVAGDANVRVTRTCTTAAEPSGKGGERAAVLLSDVRFGVALAYPDPTGEVSFVNVPAFEGAPECAGYGADLGRAGILRREKPEPKER